MSPVEMETAGREKGGRLGQRDEEWKQIRWKGDRSFGKMETFRVGSGGGRKENEIWRGHNGTTWYIRRGQGLIKGELEGWGDR